MEDRGMMEIILTVCAIANPGNCEEKYLQLNWDGSINQCMCAVDRPAPGMDGQEMELRLSRDATPGHLIGSRK
jgi:hypothetical protein